MTNTVTRQCFQPWTSLHVAANGDVFPCCVALQELVIGSLKHQTPDEILFGSRLRKLRQQLLSGDIAGTPCAGCHNAPMAETKVFFAALAGHMIASSQQAGVSIIDASGVVSAQQLAQLPASTSAWGSIFSRLIRLTTFRK
jgi:radical SAM protein with 4Fe4S-binding SPASM domain